MRAAVHRITQPCGPEWRLSASARLGLVVLSTRILLALEGKQPGARQRAGRMTRTSACVWQYRHSTSTIPLGSSRQTVPTLFILMDLHVSPPDLAYDDIYFQQGTYLRAHAELLALWHGLEE